MCGFFAQAQDRNFGLQSTDSSASPLGLRLQFFSMTDEIASLYLPSYIRRTICCQPRGVIAAAVNTQRVLDIIKQIAFGAQWQTVALLLYLRESLLIGTSWYFVIWTWFVSFFYFLCEVVCRFYAHCGTHSLLRFLPFSLHCGALFQLFRLPSAQLWKPLGQF